MRGGWFDDPPPPIPGTYLRPPVLCHGHDPDWPQEPDEDDLSDPADDGAFSSLIHS